MEVIDAKNGIYGSKFGERHVNGTRSWEFRTTDLTKLKNAYEMTDDLLYLPYFADVTEDLPSRCKFEPTTYKNCQLMVETNCGYKYFFHRETGENLIIAINSNTYEPILPTPTQG
ncbi:hypothetical protein E6Q11_05125 [Candidatus Dojkabacteria bacterium]|uniref:Uncharacterized protein n=1 Tax=Candidatus Dojkabacteria bacterium TaxID=2099670 RepID=A0A5C7J4M6_9BACT|nr:MAG: hypothetical protein E6Q11_05125 [Candidatus Dojkabacteria bacterium]